MAESSPSTSATQRHDHLDSMSRRKVDVLRSFIQEQLQKHRSLHHHHHPNSTSGVVPPLIVGMQGPQGSGKTTITRHIVDACSNTAEHESHKAIRVACLSLDDLYLPFEGLNRVAEANPDNRLLSGRGQPGTHDLPLGRRILSQIKALNSDEERSVSLPIFDKSLHGGKGDRSPETLTLSTPPPLDVLLFEGWCLGFEAYEDEEELRRVYRHARSQTSEQGETTQRTHPSRGPYFLSHPLEHLLVINNHLRRLNEELYPFLDSFIQLVPSSPSPSSSSSAVKESTRDLTQIFRWRQQAEHAMKASNGGKGMTDDQVVDFVARYMPGYELWDRGTNEGLTGGGEDVDGRRDGATGRPQTGSLPSTLEIDPSKWRFREAGSFVRLGLGKERELLWVDRGDGPRKEETQGQGKA